MNALHQILVATDGSEQAHLAVQLVASMRWPAETGVEILDVEEPFLGPTEIPAPELEREIRERIDVELAASKAQLGAMSHVQTALRSGRAPEEIVREAARTGAELIVLGSRGLGPIATMLLGSVAAEVVDRAPCPVLVARVPKMTRAILADDGSKAAARATLLLQSAPPLQAMTTRVVSVAPVFGVRGYASIRHEDATQEYAESVDALRGLHAFIARDAVERLTSAHITADDEVRLGDPAAEIIDAAREFAADVIVMGSRGQRGLERLLIGSVTRNVLTHAPMSVLIVPPERATAL